MQVRQYQEDLKAAIRSEWSAGHQNVMAVAPTGSGKTAVLSDIVREHDGASCVIAHRQEIVGQLSLAMARNGVRHHVIAAEGVVRMIHKLHIRELGQTWVDARSPHVVAGVQTLVRHPAAPWMNRVSLFVCDEAHHLLVNNQWGRAAAMFPTAHGLLVTATPIRADGAGLGRAYDGVVDAMVLAPSMRDLIHRGYLAEYRIFGVPSDVDYSDVPLAASGDLSLPALRAAVHKSGTIVGDVVSHYLRIAPGKSGVTFAVDIEAGKELTAAYRQAGVPAELITGKTDDLTRSATMRRFARGDFKQLVSVDILGEGVDVPGIEVASMVRKTESLSLYMQQCLDSGTEVLTSRGWVGRTGILPSDLVASIKVGTGDCEFLPILSQVDRVLDVSEEMYGIKSPHLDIRVTGGHDMLVASKASKVWVKQAASVTASRKAMFKIPVSAKISILDAEITDDELRFVGWFLTDGTLHKANRNVIISQSAGKPFHCESIRVALRGCGFKFGEYHIKRTGEFAHCSDGVMFSVSHGDPRGTMKHLRGYSSLAPWIDKNMGRIFDTLSARQVRVLLSAMDLGDGNNCADKRSWERHTMALAMGTNEAMADRMQGICVTRGLRVNKARYVSPKGAVWWTLHVRDVGHATIAGTGIKDGAVSGKKKYRRSRFEAQTRVEGERVWCVENSNGSLITRRNGKVAILGNCGRALRPAPGKTHAIIIDHVGNVIRHNLPDVPRDWSVGLRRRDRRASKPKTGEIPLRQCLNPTCMAVYERVYRACPHCGVAPTIMQRSAPEHVDGDLSELSPEACAALRGEIDAAGKVAFHPDRVIQASLVKKHREKTEEQTRLREAISLYGGWRESQGHDVSMAQRYFFFEFGIDVGTAQTLGRADAESLRVRVIERLTLDNVIKLGGE